LSGVARGALRQAVAFERGMVLGGVAGMSRCICLLAVLVAVPAHAEPGNHVTVEAFEADGGNNAVNHELAPSSGLGVDLRITIGPVVFGALGDINPSLAPWKLFGLTDSHVGVLAGAELASWPLLANTAHLQVLGEVGEHQFYDLGEDLVDKPVGNSSAELPYVGLRAGVSAISKSGLFAGLWASARSDLDTKSMDVMVIGPFCDPCTAHVDLGGTALDVLVVAGFQR
jgi:hypothetical protein